MPARLEPDDGFEGGDVADDVGHELFNLPEDLSDGIQVIEEPIPHVELCMFGRETHPPLTLMVVLQCVDYGEVDDRIALPKGVRSTEEWGATEITMPKFKGLHTFESLAEMALGDREAIRYCGFIKCKYLKDYTVTPTTQSPDLAGYLPGKAWFLDNVTSKILG